MATSSDGVLRIGRGRNGAKRSGVPLEGIPSVVRKVQGMDLRAKNPGEKCTEGPGHGPSRKEIPDQVRDEEGQARDGQAVGHKKARRETGLLEDGSQRGPS